MREQLLDRWVKTAETYYRNKARTVCYLSAEFLLGPHLGNNLVNLGAVDATGTYQTSDSRGIVPDGATGSGMCTTVYPNDARCQRRLSQPWP